MLRLLAIGLAGVLIAHRVDSNNSLGRNCGSDNDLKEVVIKFVAFKGVVTGDIVAPQAYNVIQGKDTAAWVSYRDVEFQFATVGEIDTDQHLITFDQIPTSLGYFCKSDGAIGISIGAKYNRQSVINLNSIWHLKHNEFHKLNVQAKKGRLHIQLGFVNRRISDLFLIIKYIIQFFVALI